MATDLDVSALENSTIESPVTPRKPNKPHLVVEATSPENIPQYASTENLPQEEIKQQEKNYEQLSLQTIGEDMPAHLLPLEYRAEMIKMQRRKASRMAAAEKALEHAAEVAKEKMAVASKAMEHNPIKVALNEAKKEATKQVHHPTRRGRPPGKRQTKKEEEQNLERAAITGGFQHTARGLAFKTLAGPNAAEIQKLAILEAEKKAIVAAHRKELAAVKNELRNAKRRKTTVRRGKGKKKSTKRKYSKKKKT